MASKRYYVRAGLRNSAMQFPSGMKVPKYLLLHKKNSALLFILKDTSPKLVTSKELLELGFHPSSDIYWLFELDERVNGNLVDKVLHLVLANGVMKVQPYIIELDIKWHDLSV